MSKTPDREPASSPEEVARLIARLAVKIPWNWVYLRQDIEARDEIEGVTGVSMNQFFKSIELAVERMPPTPPTKAVANALGLHSWKGETLGSRRRDFVQKHNISERTLIRHERKGAEQLAALIYPDYSNFEPVPEIPTLPELFPTADEWADLGNRDEKSTDAERIVDLERRLALVEKALAELQKSVGKPL